jgi:ABC-type amino acid transport system permease subunit
MEAIGRDLGMTFHDSALGYIIAMLVAAIIGFAVVSVRLVARGVRLARSLDIIRGIRLLVLALAASLAAIGVASGKLGFVVVGAIILAEELYETGLVAAIIRFGERTVSPTPGELTDRPDGTS